MSRRNMDIKEVYKRLSRPIWGVFVFSILTISGLVYVATQGQDRNAVKASVHLAHAAVSAMARDLSNLTLEYAFWDQAVDNLVTNMDADWADENIGSFLTETYDISSSYVLGPDGRPVYSSVAGERHADDPLKRFSGGLKILIARARSGEASAVPEPATGLVRDSGSIYLASVVVLTTYFSKDGEEVNQATESVLILTKKLTEDLLAELAENYLLHDLRYQASPESASAASIPMFAADGAAIGNLVWNPDLPGTRIVSVLLVGIAIVFVLMAAIMMVFLRRAKEFSHKLVGKSELLKSTLDSVDQGIAAWDHQNKLLTWNAKCEDFWYHPPDVRVGMSKRDLVGHISAQGGFGSGASNEIAEQRYLEFLEDGADSSDEFLLHDGRYITLYRYPMPSGGHTVVYSDVTDRKMVEQQLLHQATIDSVTGLPNRIMLFDRITQAMEHARRENNNIGLIFVDLDLFKEVNDACGHAAGDLLLKLVGVRLRKQVREEDTVARLGGDEFVILLNDVEKPGGSDIVATKIVEAFKKSFDLAGRETFITASLGIAVFPDDGEDPEILLQHADAAMYESKNQGRNTFRFFNAQPDGQA